MNLERLKKLYTFLDTKVREREQRNPNLFQMDYWANGFFENSDMSCNTAACALGHATQCFPDDLELYVNPFHLINVRCKDDTSIKGLCVAEHFFDLTVNEAEYIFHPPSYIHPKLYAFGLRYPNKELSRYRTSVDMVLRHMQEIMSEEYRLYVKEEQGKRS